VKILHSSHWETESTCHVSVDVHEGRNLDADATLWREISVRIDANLTANEARRLIVDLQHAVALAEEPPAVTG
jgi:hypothetical protein